jgi:sulfur-oxidizing protein SoxY
MKRWLGCAVLVGAACFATVSARAEETPASRAQRWTELEHALFGSRTVLDGSALLSVQTPVRAMDAALVPVGITVAKGAGIKGLYLVIDDNPAPMAAHFSFGPEADPHALHLRVRVDQYTLVHAVAETKDGKLYSVASFVKAAGGCSAPAGTDAADALKDIGHMKLRLLGSFAPNEPVEAQLLIRHPNFNGMQMNQVTRLYTPARFINSVDVSYNNAKVFHLDSDISLSSDPAITFGFVPHDKGELEVVAHDTKGSIFTDSFDVPARAS